MKRAVHEVGRAPYRLKVSSIQRDRESARPKQREVRRRAYRSASQAKCPALAPSLTIYVSQLVVDQQLTVLTRRKKTWKSGQTRTNPDISGDGCAASSSCSLAAKGLTLAARVSENFSQWARK